MRACSDRVRARLGQAIQPMIPAIARSRELITVGAELRGAQVKLGRSVREEPVWRCATRAWRHPQARAPRELHHRSMTRNNITLASNSDITATSDIDTSKLLDLGPLKATDGMQNSGPNRRAVKAPRPVNACSRRTCLQGPDQRFRGIWAATRAAGETGTQV